MTPITTYLAKYHYNAPTANEGHRRPEEVSGSKSEDRCSNLGPAR